MATVLLAVGDRSLRLMCEAALAGAGHSSVAIERPLALLSIPARVRGDVVLVDGSVLGRDALRAAEADFAGRTAGLGLEAASLAECLPLPVTARQVAGLVDRLCRAAAEPVPLSLDAARRVVQANGREVMLTRTEFALLEVLMQRRGAVVPLDEAMESVWGAGEWSRNLTLLRVHVRNLRQKLAHVGLPNAVRSRRGRGYVLAL